jgi:hypothetical protein
MECNMVDPKNFHPLELQGLADLAAHEAKVAADEAEKARAHAAKLAHGSR